MANKPAIKPWLARWDERFSRGEETFDFEPSPLLVEAVQTAEPGLALDLASGAGRHALFLAGEGWQVDAVDGSRVGVGVMMKEAETRGLSRKIHAHVADLEALPPAFPIEDETYELIVDFCFMHRPFFSQIRSGLCAGGLFVAAIHVTPEGGDAPHRFALESGELEEMVLAWGWEVFAYRENPPAGREKHGGGSHGREGWTTAELIARKPPA